MAPDHAHQRRLILGHEDLEGDERAEADAHLAQCATCRRLLDRVLAAEAAVRSVASLPATGDPLAGLSDVERAQARISRDSLRKDGPERSLFRFRPRRLLQFAIAAVMVFAVLLPVLHHGTPVRDLQIGSPLVLRGGDDEPAATEHGVSFRLARAGYPVLIHVDGAGVARLVFPAPGTPPSRFAKGQQALLPPPQAGLRWRDALAAGCETYLLAIATGPTPPDLSTLTHLPTAASRDDALRAASKRLVRLAGPVARRDASNCR